MAPRKTRKKASTPKKQKSGPLDLNLSSVSAMWIVILLMTFVTAIASFSDALSHYDQNSLLLTSALFFVLSFAFLAGIIRNDTKLLLSTAAVEFVIMLLPLLSFSTVTDYLPYSIGPIFLLSYPVLWVLLPPASMMILNDKELLKKLKIALILTAVIMELAWFNGGLFTANTCTYYGPHTICEAYFSWGSFLLLTAFNLIPLAIWIYTYRHLGGKPTTARLLRFLPKPCREYVPEILLVLTIAFLLLAGYLLNPTHASYEPSCGDSWCDYYYGENSDNCPSDCHCGDMFCTPPEDVVNCPGDCYCGDYVCSFGENESNCPTDCGPCGDGICTDNELDWCADDCGVYEHY